MQLVLDTNVVLDLLVFADPQAQALKQGLESGALQWLATAAMREELARVLAYPKLAPRVAFHRGDAQAVLGDFDRRAQLLDAPAKAPVTCGDPDDQKFIDLAVADAAVDFMSWPRLASSWSSSSMRSLQRPVCICSIASTMRSASRLRTRRALRSSGKVVWVTASLS